MQEIWKDIKGYERLYQVSNFGRIKSIKNNKEKILKLCANNKGYLCINLCRDKKLKRFLVHRLVAEAFINNFDNKPFVNHLDCNPSNNQVTNLEMCTQKENIQYCINLGRNYTRKVYQFSLLGEFLREYKSITEANKITNISVSHISQCCNKQRNKAGNYQWSFKEDIESMKNYKRKTRAKKIIQILDKNIINKFDSITKAEDETKILKTSIINCLKARTKSAGGYIWKYGEE